MIVALGLPLKVTTIILGCIFSVLFRDFRAHGPISIPTPPIVALTEFFHEDAVANVMIYCRSCQFSSWHILFKVLTLSVTICIVFLHFSNFCFSLISVADFSNTEARAPASAGRAPFSPARRAMQFGQVV